MTSRSISLSFPDFHFAHTGSRGGGGEQNSVSLKFYSFDCVGIKGENHPVAGILIICGWLSSR